MKHLLNSLTENEKNSIREQHTGGMKVMTENFSKLVNTKSGDVKTLVEQQVTTQTTTVAPSSQTTTKPEKCSERALTFIKTILSGNADLTLIFNQIERGVVTVVSKDAKLNCGCYQKDLIKYLQ